LSVLFSGFLVAQQSLIKSYQTINDLTAKLENKNLLSKLEEKTIIIKLASEHSLLLNHQKSLEYYLLALQEANSDSNSIEKNTIYFNIAAQFTNLSKTTEGLKYANLAIKHSNKLDTNNKQNIFLLGSCYSLLGSMYSQPSDYSSAINNLTKAEIKFKQASLDSLLADVYTNRGCIKMDSKRFASANEDFERALAIYKQNADKPGISTTYINLSSSVFNAFDAGLVPAMKLNSSLLYLDSALFAMKDFPESLQRLNCYNYKSMIYEALNKPDSAIKYKLKYYELNEIINNKELANTITKMELSFNSKLKDNEIENLKYQNTIIKNEQRIKTQVLIFIVVCAVLLALLALALYRLKLLRLKRKTYEVDQKVSRAQMDPHFTFNAINSVQEYILLNDPEKAHFFLSKFAKVIRNFLNNNQKATIDLKSELNFLNDYLDLESERFRKPIHLNVENQTQLELEHLIILPGVLQPLCENAIWHGYTDDQASCNLVLTVANKDELLILKLEDNGQGSNDYSGSENSKALKLIQERLKLIHPKNNSAFKIERASKGGTIVTLLFPHQLKHNA
jgi:tetratricopeptide (TPR) repeat protein